MSPRENEDAVFWSMAQTLESEGVGDEAKADARSKLRIRLGALGLIAGLVWMLVLMTINPFLKGWLPRFRERL